MIPASDPLPERCRRRRPPHLRRSRTQAEESAPGWYAVRWASRGSRRADGDDAYRHRPFHVSRHVEANLLVNVASNQGATEAPTSASTFQWIFRFGDERFLLRMPDQYTVYFVAQFDRPFLADGRGKPRELFHVHRRRKVPPRGPG